MHANFLSLPDRRKVKGVDPGRLLQPFLAGVEARKFGGVWLVR